MTPTLAQARQAVGPATNTRIILHEEGYTEQIIQAVVAAAAIRHDLAILPRMLSGATPHDTGRNIHNFLRENIRYVVDQPGVQDIPKPHRMLADGKSDCKGYSIFTSAVLTSLGIPHALRFVSFQPGPVTHVYTILSDGTPIDACMPKFGQEKPYLSKKDYIMSQIALISGIGSTVTQGEAYARIVDELAELEYRAGIGTLDRVNRRALILSTEDDFARKAGKNVPLFANAVTPAEQEVAKTTLQNIREGASYFLYLFLTDPKAIAALSPEAASQRAEAVQTARYLTETLGMSQTVFMKVVRLGIMQQTGASPEQILLASVPAEMAGIGFLPLIPLAIKAATSIVPIAKKAIPFIKNAVSKVKTALPNAASTPAPNPTKGLSPIKNFISKAKGQIQPFVANLTQNGKAGNVPATTDTMPAPSPDYQAPASGKKEMPSWVLPAAGLAVVGFGLAMSGGKKKRR